MSNDTPAPRLTPEEYDAFFAPPEFVPPNEVQVRALLDDNEGNTWVFIDEWTNMLHHPISAKLDISGDVIEIALRADWMESKKPIPPNESPVLGRRAWRKLTGQVTPDHWNRTHPLQGLYAVRLPFRPQQVRMVGL